MYPSQSPFVDFILDTTRLKNDAALCRLAGLAPPVISRLRHGRQPVTPTILLALHEATSIPVATLRAHIVG